MASSTKHTTNLTRAMWLGLPAAARERHAETAGIKLPTTAAGSPRHGSRRRQGKISLVAAIALLLLVALAGLIGNAGHTAHQKIATQNAADAAAYSSALWAARGMNALTATNHMLGEATAMAAVHEAIAGPELDLNIKRNTSENRTLNQMIRTLKPAAPIGTPIPSPFGFTPPPVRTVDQRIVNFVTKRTSPNQDDMTAFATIYDSRMTLKRELRTLLAIKNFADIGFFVPPPWGYATAAAAYVAHIAATSQIVLIGKEWIVIEVLEVVAKLFKPAKGIIEDQLIPALIAHNEFIASYERGSSEPTEGIVNKSIERAVNDLANRHDAELAIFPKVKELRLPVEPEPKPNLQGGGGKPTGWGEDRPPTMSNPLSEFADFRRQLAKSQRRMERRRNELQRDIRELDRYESDIEKRLDEDDVSASERAELQQELRDIEASRREKQKRIDDIDRELQRLAEKEAELEQMLNSPMPNRSNNPSIASIPQRMDREQERLTQWTRATYPYADGFRAPLVAWLKQWAPKSKADEHLVKWANRYTLVKGWQFRSGYRPTKSGDRVRWNKSKDRFPMFVLKDSYEGENSQKGQEPWTETSTQGKNKAEDYFTLIGFAHRKYEPLFARRIFPAAS
ncbi:MAG: pilus assembly protein TadG-related protein, partial [Planctomycetota bacterium]